MVSAAVATEKTWQISEWQVQDLYYADQDIILQDPKTRSNKQWYDCGNRPSTPLNAADVTCSGAFCAAVCPIGWRSRGRWKIKCQENNTWSHSFSPCITCRDMSVEIDDHIKKHENGADARVIYRQIFKKNLPVAEFFCEKSTSSLRMKNHVFKNGGQKRDVKCLCKKGQNGDPAWMRSCNWSFKRAPWYPSDVKSVTCKGRF